MSKLIYVIFLSLKVAVSKVQVHSIHYSKTSTDSTHAIHNSRNVITHFIFFFKVKDISFFEWYLKFDVLSTLMSIFSLFLTV